MSKCYGASQYRDGHWDHPALLVIMPCVHDCTFTTSKTELTPLVVDKLIKLHRWAALVLQQC